MNTTIFYWYSENVLENKLMKNERNFRNKAKTRRTHLDTFMDYFWESKSLERKSKVTIFMLDILFLTSPRSPRKHYMVQK